MRMRMTARRITSSIADLHAAAMALNVLYGVPSSYSSRVAPQLKIGRMQYLYTLEFSLFKLSD